MMRIETIPYNEDSTQLFDNILHLPWPTFLDSGRPYINTGRYDIISANPYLTLTTFNNTTIISNGNSITFSQADPLSLLDRHLNISCLSPINTPLPFSGGAIGYFSYDLSWRFEKLPRIKNSTEQVPDMAIGLYDWAVVVDHATKQSFLIGRGVDPKTFKNWENIKSNLLSKNKYLEPDLQISSKVSCNMDYSLYQDAFNKVKKYILDGDCYQVNLSRRFSTKSFGNTWHLYRKFRQINPAPFAAYLTNPYVSILSSSPERFLLLKEGTVETKPIKGTRPRSNDTTKDLVFKQELLDSSKDKAENLMIVDLLRNDLGKICSHGTITVPELFSIETYATVHHLVSTVCGCLSKNENAVSLLRSCFPGGSITGAPKIRAMEIIEELEPNRRGVYCGSIGYIDFNSRMDLNIAIRTIQCINHDVRYWAGGGLVHDSELQSEYEEIKTKALPFFKLTSSHR